MTTKITKTNTEKDSRKIRRVLGSLATRPPRYSKVKTRRFWAIYNRELWGLHIDAPIESRYTPLSESPKPTFWAGKGAIRPGVYGEFVQKPTEKTPKEKHFKTKYADRNRKFGPRSGAGNRRVNKSGNKQGYKHKPLGNKRPDTLWETDLTDFFESRKGYVEESKGLKTQIRPFKPDF